MNTTNNKKEYERYSIFFHLTLAFVRLCGLSYVDEFLRFQVVRVMVCLVRVHPSKLYSSAWLYMYIYAKYATLQIQRKILLTERSKLGSSYPERHEGRARLLHSRKQRLLDKKQVTGNVGKTKRIN